MDHLEESYKSKIVNIDKLEKSDSNKNKSKKSPKYENKQLSNKQYQYYYTNYEDGLWLTGC